jgi:hypothetical protein
MKPNKKHEKKLKRKKKVEGLKRNKLPLTIAKRQEEKARRVAYKKLVDHNKKAINLKLKRALGLPDDEEISTEKLVQAMNLRIKMDKEKREKEASQDVPN